MMRILGLLSVGILAALAQTPAQLDEAWRKAVLAKDVAALDKMLAADLVYAHATGIVDTKQTYLAKIQSGRQLYRSMEQRKISARSYGETAVTHSWMHVTGVNQAGPFDDKVMMLHVWVKQAGVWRLAAHQTTKVDQLP
jgi:ketosteroid isomerase-like protein